MGSAVLLQDSFAFITMTLFCPYVLLLCWQKTGHISQCFLSLATDLLKRLEGSKGNVLVEDDANKCL